MQFDQKKLMQIGAAVLVAILAAVFGLNGSGGTDAAKEAPPVALDAPAATPALSEAKPAGVGEVTMDAAPGKTATIDAVPALAPSKAKPAALPVADGDFDYYLLVLSWSPTHCSSDAGRGRDDDLQCRSGRPFGFVVHGLWPQYERGYPQDCSTRERTVSSSNMTAALKIQPARGLVQHEWEKHGTCSGLSQDDYFATASAAFSSVKIPATYQALSRPLVTTADEVRRQFLQANRSFPNDGISATCARNELAEVWACLDKNLQPRSCSADVRRKHCGGRQVRMLSVRGDWPR